jgi:hypothetical protein
VLELKLYALTLRQLCPPRDRQQRYTKLVGQVSDDQSTEQTDFLDVKIVHRWACLTDPRSTEVCTSYLLHATGIGID